VLNSFSIPASFGKGYRFYINVNHELKKTLTLSWRWSQTIQIGQNSIGSGLDEIPFNHRTEVSCQLQWFF